MAKNSNQGVPGEESDSQAEAPAASQLWRDRLNKTKTANNQMNPTGASGDKTGKIVPNRFQNTAAGNTAQKTRKGMRAG